MANNETLPEYKNSKENYQSDYSTSEIDRKLLELAVQEKNTKEWRRKFKQMSKELSEKMVDQDTPDKNDEQYNKQSITELQDAAPKDSLITEVRTKLTDFSGSLASRAKHSLSSLYKKWHHLPPDSRKGVLHTLGVISSNIEVFGNADKDPIGAIRGGINIVASISSNFGPKGQLASVALGFVSALLGLFGKGPKPKTLGEVVREQIHDALSEYRDESLAMEKHGFMLSFQLSKAYLDEAADSDGPLTTDEVIMASNKVVLNVNFIGKIAYLIEKLFRNNKVGIARKAIRYCEMYAEVAFYRDIILTQFISMIPRNNKNVRKHLNGMIADREVFRRMTRAVLAKLYVLDYDSRIIPYFDPDVNVITDTFSTKILNLGNDYDRSMAGMHCLMTQGRGGLKDLDWKRAEKSFKPAGNPYTTLVPHNNLNCYWKLVPHAGNTYSIINKFRCGNYDYCGAMLSWSVVDGQAYVDITRGDPVLWEIGGNEWKYIRNKQGCGARGSGWCNYHLRMKIRRIYRRFWGFRYSGSSMRKKIVGQLRPSNGRNYWKIRKARG
ncbi:uncharacterized protein LOC114575187 [Exaiptasia diaphana]|uniref:Uncharacterized protein n=1 Tax=Exaiptasia diaphana TaxID=2652724 RepID=A0A913YLI9_EXADI|nr:uncharacterized protein LOC114575187 [Exaiptasia diaphana]